MVGVLSAGGSACASSDSKHFKFGESGIPLCGYLTDLLMFNWRAPELATPAIPQQRLTHSPPDLVLDLVVSDGKSSDSYHFVIDQLSSGGGRGSQSKGDSVPSSFICHGLHRMIGVSDFKSLFLGGIC